MNNTTINRRTILRGAGVCLSLPLLEAMIPKAKAAEVSAPQRLAILAQPFGMVRSKFHPAETGFDYETPETLKPLEGLREDFSIFSNLDHDVRGGHQAWHTFLSGIKLTERAGYKNGNISLDQRAAELIGNATRFPSLNFWGEKVSYTRTGVKVPSVHNPSDAFRLLFVDQTAGQRESARAGIASSASILDTVLDEARSIQNRVGAADKQKLEEYFNSVRETERRLQISERWLDTPKPTVNDPRMKGVKEGTRDTKLGSNLLPVWLDLTYLALQTDSSRVATITVAASNWALEGVTDNFHTLSHHGQRPNMLSQLAIVENHMISEFARFAQRLKDTPEATGGNMLDNTMVFFGSGLGSGSLHDNVNLPLILAGGGFKHGQHFDCERRIPLCNLYLTILQQLGAEIDRFNLSDGTFGGLV